MKKVWHGLLMNSDSPLKVGLKIYTKFTIRLKHFLTLMSSHSITRLNSCKNFKKRNLFCVESHIKLTSNTMARLKYNNANDVMKIK